MLSELYLGSVFLTCRIAGRRNGAKKKMEREKADQEGKKTSGPNGYGEASCGTVSFYDEPGELLSTIRIARMPESKKLTLKSMLTYKVSKIITEYPNLKLVKIKFRTLSPEVLRGTVLSLKTALHQRQEPTVH